MFNRLCSWLFTDSVIAALSSDIKELMILQLVYICRYIRLACECLGPRGNDKSGCRDSWEAYCHLVERRSRIMSFKSNRFNNLFQAAAALHFHRSDISDCLGAKENRKIESMFQDNLCDTVDTQLIALGLLYHRVTGPH